MLVDVSDFSYEKAAVHNVMPDRHGSLAALSRKKLNAKVSDRIHCWGTRKTQVKINCEQAQELITALVDRELDQAERSTLEAHLEECSGCRLAFEEELLSSGKSTKPASACMRRLFAQ